MKSSNLFAAFVSFMLLLSACTPSQGVPAKHAEVPTGDTSGLDITRIELRDSDILVDSSVIGSDPANAVYVANDIVYYESGKDFTYGEGTQADSHSAQDAAAHTVVHITQPGTYRISGTLQRGQIAVDLGEAAQDDPAAVVTLILDGVDIACEVAPAVIFYHVYECGSSDAEAACKDVDTSAAGANVVIADNSVNNVSGSYVARIYRPESVVLNEEGTQVEDAKKLHKYDAAFYSRMSMNIGAERAGTGVLNIQAENEGLDSELHLTINGGNINIRSGNDGINTNEDGVSVTTVNGGRLTIQITGETGEGDGIDSNGWLVINGGAVLASACSTSQDAGIDSDMGIHINGGTVIAAGHMLDHIEDGGQTYTVFNFAQKQRGGDMLSLKNESGDSVMQLYPENDYSILVCSSPDLTPGSYTLCSGGQQLACQSSGAVTGPGMPGSRPTGMMPPEEVKNRDLPEGEPPFAGMELPQGELPFDAAPEGNFPSEHTPPTGAIRPERPELPDTPQPPAVDGGAQALTAEFQIVEGANLFFGVTAIQ